MLEGGRLVEAGTHTELLRRGGLYHRLAGFQAGQPQLATVPIGATP